MNPLFKYVQSLGFPGARRHFERMRGRRGSRLALYLSIVGVAPLRAIVVGQQPLLLDDSCIMTVGNQTVQVDADGGFVIPNIAIFKSVDTGIPPQLFRARVTCTKNGITTTGQSAYFTLVPGFTTFVGDVFPGELTPIPKSLTVSASGTFVPKGQTVQLTVTAKYADGTTKDVTAPIDGTAYVSTNSSLLTVSSTGLVTGQNAKEGPMDGTIAVLHEGNLSTISLKAVGSSSDFDNDGMPNAWEVLYGLNQFSNDANLDKDGDGLSNIKEFLAGTIPNDPDTDEDGILDGVDGDPLHPEEGPPTVEILSPIAGAPLIEGQVVLFSALIKDDGLLTSAELKTSTGIQQSFTSAPFQVSLTVPIGITQMTFDASGDDSVGNHAAAQLVVAVIPDPLTTVVGRVVDAKGMAIDSATVTATGGQGGLSAVDGSFSIPGVQTVFGEVSVKAEKLVDGKFLKGKSPSLPPVLGGITTVGDIELGLGDLVACFQDNLGGPTLSLLISGDVATTGKVEFPWLAQEVPFNVVPGVITNIPVPGSAEVTLSGQTIQRGIAISADGDISVYGLNQSGATTDAFASLPLSAIDTDYFVMSYGSDLGHSQFAVVATEDDTTVTITPSQNTANHPAGIPFDVVLDRLQVFQLFSLGTTGDLTGSRVHADKSVAVFGGHDCARVPKAITACDHLTDQIPATSSWGKHLLSASLAGRVNGDTFRILALADETSVEITGPTSQTVLLDAGEFKELILDGVNEFVADQPILVAQFANGTSYDNKLGDPFIMVLAPSDQFKSSYTFTTPATAFSSNFVNVIAPSEEAALGGVLLDNVPLPASAFVPIGSSGFSAARPAISLGTHRVHCTKPIGVYVYGWGSADSYGYPGGSRL